MKRKPQWRLSVAKHDNSCYFCIYDDFVWTAYTGWKEVDKDK